MACFPRYNPGALDNQRRLTAGRLPIRERYEKWHPVVSEKPLGILSAVTRYHLPFPVFLPRLSGQRDCANSHPFRYSAPSLHAGRLGAENRFLSEKIDALVKRVFGSSSEQMNSAQMELEGFLQEGKADAPALAESGTAGAGSPSCENEPEARKVRRQRLPEHLPVEEEVIVPLEVQAAPEAFRRIGEEVSERLDYRPARYLRLRTVRPKFVSVDNKTLPPVVAPVGPQLAEKLQATPAMIAHVIVGKYADHMPLYRQAAILQDRHGLNTTRQTL